MCPTSPRFRPTPQQTYALITVGFLSVGYALYLRYMIVENVQFGLNCDAGWPTWGCLSRKVGLALDERGVFGWVAIAAAVLNLVRPRVVLFFTDGQSSVDPVLEAAKRDQRDVRVFTVGFGPDVNRQLLARLAALKRGRFTAIPVATSIEREVAALYHQIEAPVLVDVSLEVDGAVFNRLYPRTLPDLFVDDELRITGRLRVSVGCSPTFGIR